MTTGDRTLLFGLLGNPVAHSLSPFIMNRAFAIHEIDATYVAFGVAPDRLETAVGGLWAMGASGVNVTYPFKEEILYSLDAISTAAEIVQAVNTIVFTDDTIEGINTDATGVAVALERFAEVTVERRRVFIFGAGGSARAAAYGLLERGAESVAFCARTPERAEMTMERFHFAFPEQEIALVPQNTRGDAARRRRLLRAADVVINATPVGMAGVAEGRILEHADWIRPEQIYFDFVYHPRHTPFLQAARGRRARTLDGLALLVTQAAQSFHVWTDHTFDVGEMAAAVEAFANGAPPREQGVN
jgi:shikimate dehydrogenase